MKVRWREHEMICVAVLVAAQIIITLLKIYGPSYREAITDIANEFKNNGYPFISWKNLVLPQICSLVLIYLGYLSVNLVIIPSIKKVPVTGFTGWFTINLIKPLAAIAVTSFLLAAGVNLISWFALPHLYNYWDYPFLSIFGFNERPLTNLFFGLDMAAGIIGFTVAAASLREFIIWLIERPGPGKEYRVLVTNTATSLLFICLLAVFLIHPIRENSRLFVAYVIPVLFLYVYLTYWLFPVKIKIAAGKKLPAALTPSVIAQLFFSTLAGSLPPVFILGKDASPFPFYVFWLFLLLVITPVCWLFYLLGKDKIARCRNMEAALARSTADLQFLRSQINPHFLFNALNTLYGTALKESAEHTAEGVQRLGDMMRFMLHENNLDFISMEKEMEYLKNYIALQKLRTQSLPHIHIEDNIDEVKCNGNIAPMLLIPFAENAFKHGISLKDKSWITIRLTCTGTTTSFEVKNSIHTRSDEDTEKDKSGIGLKNVAERLKLLYPGRHELHVSENENEFTARLVIY